jgi:uncharacterized protein YjiS (DUF1127 family)
MIKKLRNRWSGSYKSRALSRRTYHELSGLNDHMLRDIGLSRFDLMNFRHNPERNPGPRSR